MDVFGRKIELVAEPKSTLKLSCLITLSLFTKLGHLINLWSKGGLFCCLFLCFLLFPQWKSSKKKLCHVMNFVKHRPWLANFTNTVGMLSLGWSCVFLRHTKLTLKSIQTFLFSNNRSHDNNYYDCITYEIACNKNYKKN